MAKRAGSVNKSAAIREILKANPKMPVKEVRATLAERGVHVAPPLVYVVKAKAKLRRRRRKQLRKRMDKAARNGNPVELIMKVKDLAAEAGGFGKLKQLVEVLAD